MFLSYPSYQFIYLLHAYHEYGKQKLFALSYTIWRQFVLSVVNTYIERIGRAFRSTAFVGTLSTSTSISSSPFL